MTTAATWSSSDPTIATVDAGLVSAGAFAGPVAISAEYAGFTSTATVTVTFDLAVGLEVAPPAASLLVGADQAYEAHLLYADGTYATVTADSNLTWSVADEAIATISNEPGQQGVATGVAPGTTEVTAEMTFSACPAYPLTSPPASLVVVAGDPIALEVVPASSSVAVGSLRAFTALMHYTDGSIIDVTAQADWSSDDAAIATVSNDPGTEGIAIGVAPGDATITASAPAVGGPATATATLTVE